MKYYRSLLTTIIFLLAFLLVEPVTINAVDCFPSPNIATFTVSGSCSFAGTINGVDYGTGAVNTAVLKPALGTTITVSAGQTLATGSIDLMGVGSFILISGGQIKLNTPLYITDTDVDGYPANTTQYTSSATGRVRRYTLTSMTADCDESTSAKYQNRTCYYDGDNDGFRTATSVTRCVGVDCTNSSDAYKRESSATIDCNDAAYSATNTCCTDTWVCDTCYNTCCATCCSEHQNCGGTCGGCASGPFSGCSNYDVWNASHTCYCSYCQINYSCEPCTQCNPYSCNCRWVCI